MGRFLGIVALSCLFAVPPAGDPMPKDARMDDPGAVEKLAICFGPNQAVDNAKFKFDVRKSSRAFACNEVVFLSDGRVKLVPGMCGHYNIDPNTGKYEGGGILSKHFEITFDPPAKSIEDMMKSRIKRIDYAGGSVSVLSD
jgi:hypothetical protein